ncbi:uncharacterized protein LOC101850745 isoform X2 [Aplysia californica]|uniref:Phospholipase A2 n=1 Tax=Aplysia californica TaxID=6500 RepID=A0ABM1VZ70_APLCA|nr:uncharacterized protein LOC101850745 isoform X2 [Aplysia californica]XP_035827714.1 uncharacterized protein LOC101850745 isoform X2 [Aplysia californica]XP_035827715.1 uncharacterized protein LOC101850745 isoform X2 [Aplysia californica]
MNCYDPYQYFEVQHTPCLILTVRVLRARNVTLGFRDYYDTPDPYINLVMRSSPEGRKSTTVKEDEPNPEWDESFTFFVNFTQANVLEISLMEYNLLWYHQVVGTVHFDLIHINQMDVFQYETFVFNDVTEVDIEFKLEFDRYPTLRYSLCLSDAEKQFIERRKAKAMEGVCNLIGEEDGPVNINEVPTVAVLGSGGGFRAMTAYSGVVKALKESGVLDCVTYACGLSGSSWLLSTLYSHPKWPNVDMAEFQEEMKQNIDKRLLRFFTPATMYKYTSYLVKKRREKQPVSFTDIFGRMVGETLLSGRMNATLTDQRETIKDGDIPMPLYTCVHVKKDVPARQFQEWVEFSPYEIGMPKYGTFMDSELFGSKFFMGKLVKKFDEQPLHFLQGIWGSAFCILFKRLLEDNRRLDPAEMMRREMGEQMLREEIGQELDEARGESSSDCSDDEIDFDSQSSIDSDAGATTGEENFRKESSVESTSSLDSQNSQDFNRVSNERRSSSQSLPTVEESNPNAQDKNGLVFNNPANDDEEEGKSGNESDMEDDEDEEDDELFKSCRFENRKGSVEMRKIEKMKQGSEELESQAPGNKLLDVVAENNDESEDAKKSVRWGACPTRGNVSKEKREAFRRASSSMRKSRSGSKSYWQQYLKSMVESKWELFSTRRGRAAVIHNFMRGLSLQQTYPLSPFTPVEKRVKEGDEFDGIFEMHPTSVKHLYMVDAGLTFNSPYPLVLRPQRQVDVILSFDFSARPSDQHQPFKELLLAEKWARLNRLPFPPIDASVFDREGMKELYIFRHPTDPHCPVVLHFVLINKDFRHYKKPGVPRETKEEFDFADFDIFDNPKAPYSTFNFTYSHENFERLSKLTEFNTLLHIEEIKQVIRDVVRLKREGPPRIPIQSKDIKLLHMKSVQEYRKLKKFISRMESRSSISTPFGTPGVQASPSTNPFFSDLKQDKLSRSSTCSSEQRHWPDRLSESHNSGLNSHRSSRNRGRRSPLSSTSSCDSVFGTPPQDQVPTFGAPGQPHNLQRQSSRGVPSNVDSSHVTGQKNSNSRQMPLFGSSAAETGILSNSCPQSSVMRDVTDSRSHPENGRHEAVPVVTATTTPAQNFDMLDSGTSLVLDDQSPFSCPSSLSPSTPHAIPSPNEAPKSPAGSSPKLKMPPLLPPPNVAQTLSSSSGSSKSFTPTSTPSTAQNTPKPKSKKELPPNPFFVNAHFMRSAYNSSSSSEGGDSEDKGKNYRLTTGSSYRRSKPSPLANGLPSHSSANTERSESNTSASSSENNHITRGSPAGLSTFHSRNLESHPELVYESSPSQTESVEGTNTQTSVTSQEPSTASPTSDDFSLAPEAFKLDGTPVTDRAQAKMFYEEAKKKRALFRRQSTVSSLNSISLEDRCQSQEVGEQDIQRASSGDSVTEIRPVASDGHHLFQDAFHSCDEGAPTSVTKEDVISMEISNLSQFQAVGSP